MCVYVYVRVDKGLNNTEKNIKVVVPYSLGQRDVGNARKV